MQDLKLIADSETGKVRPVLQRLTHILGTPEKETSGEVHGQQCIIRTFALPVWPAFLLFIAGIPEGLLYDERFVRAPDQAPPILTAPEDLHPWKVTKDEVAAAFGPLEEGDIWPPFEEYGFEHTDAEGTRSKVHVIFKFGLLE